MKDLHNNIKPVRVISPISPSATGVIAGQVIDMSGFESVEFVIQSGAQTTTNVAVTPIIKSGSATNALASVADARLLGTEAGAALNGVAGANGTSRVGYIGPDRYVTCDLQVLNAATGVYSVTAIKAGARKAPTS